MTAAPFRKVGIISKPKKETIREVVPGLQRWLREHGMEVLIDEVTADCLGAPKEGIPRELLPGQADLLIVLGGDGTLLALSRLIGESRAHILPVNLGSLGFLTSVTLVELFPILEEIVAQKHRISERVLILAEILRGGLIATKQLALNDAVVSRAALSRIMDLDLHIDGNYVCSYRADGLIVATPTGSTAYSLAAGGPIVYPILDAFIITPICPHALTNRPVVIPDSMELEISFQYSQEDIYLTFDGQVGIQLEENDRIRVKKSETKLRLVRPSRRTYFGILRDKLKWGAR
jgi:NAD+ kinase